MLVPFYLWQKGDLQNQNQLLKNTVKRVWKFKKLDYRLRKAEIGLEFLCKCDENYVVPKFLNFRVAKNHPKYSFTYNSCQLNLLREEICQKKSTARNL